MMKKVKVFIVEDSILMQKIIVDILSSDPDIEVVGSTKFGREAIEKIPQIKPDVVTLDFNLPDIDGLEVLRRLMVSCPARVMMLSAHTQKGAEVTIKALEAGALDFVPKPSGEVSLNLYTFKDEIVSKIKTIATIDLAKPPAFFVPKDQVSTHSTVRNIVIVGASTGGPKAILECMSGMQASINASFLIVQHMPSGFTKSFADRISWYSAIKTKEAEEGDVLLTGAAYVAPSGYHMVLDKNPDNENTQSYCVRLDETPLVNYVRPAVDVTFSSVAEIFEGGIIGVVLTGMGKDGLEGARIIKRKGGKIIVQNEATCAVYGMPKAIVSEGLANDILPIQDIAKKVMEYLK